MGDKKSVALCVVAIKCKIGKATTKRQPKTIRALDARKSISPTQQQLRICKVKSINTSFETSVHVKCYHAGWGLSSDRGLTC